MSGDVVAGAAVLLLACCRRLPRGCLVGLQTPQYRGRGFQRGLRCCIICPNFCSLGVVVFKTLFDQNPAFLLADRCSWLWSESWGWPCCVLEQGPDVLITTSRVILPSDCLLWSGYYEKKKQPLNFTNGLFDLNLLFPTQKSSFHSVDLERGYHQVLLLHLFTAMPSQLYPKLPQSQTLKFISVHTTARGVLWVRALK